MTMPSRTAAIALAVALGAASACGGGPSTAADTSDGLDAVDTSTQDTGDDVAPGDTAESDTTLGDTGAGDTLDPDTVAADTGPTDTAGPGDTASGDTTSAPVELCGNGTDDDGDLRADCEDADCCSDAACAEATVCTTPPEDPAADPPPLKDGEATTMDAIVAFLTSGDDPVQRGVAAGALEPRRVALLRGLVRDRVGPLTGVRVDVLGQRQLGLTVSRADGAWDLVVNADLPVTLRFSLAGYVPVQRTVTPFRRQSRRLDDVVMTAYDAAVTTVTLGSTDAQVARGSAVSDDDGDRRATLVLPPSTSASMTTPDGATTALDTASIRATELTVGADGPLAMPGELPAPSAYTYAVELSVDEAVAAGATRVDFDPPLALYVEDFLGFPVGSAVPLGAYDREAARWVTANNGRVVEIVAIAGGLADLRVSEAAGPASAQELADLGVTEAERARLAELYTVGQRLWRSPIPHFTPWDCNWPYAPPDDADPPPGTPDPDDPEPDEPDPDDDDEDDENSCRDGSIVDVQAQGLRERIPVAGTPWSLNYSSLRAEGRLTANSVDIPITLANVPDSVIGVTATVDVAGQHAARTFSAEPNQRWLYVWDGLDAFGRPIRSAVEARITVTYRYPLVYYSVPSDFQGAFNRLVAEDTTTTPVVAGSAARSSVDVTREWVVELSRTRAGVFTLAGWSLSPHHVYDPERGVLHRGDGSQRAASGLGLVVETWAGGAAGTGFDGDGGPARAAQVNSPSGMAVGPDGAFYFADTGNHRVRRIGADGIITTVAGDGSDMFPPDGEIGDGGPALDAKLPLPSDVAFAPDGSLYISESVGRVRRVDPDGIIHTVAGGGTDLSGADADGHPATEVRLSAIWNLAVASDGTLYLSETPRQRVRRVGADGILTTWLGGGTAFPRQVDGELGSEVGLTELGGIDLGPDGALYAALLNQHLVLRVAADGRTTRFAGNGFAIRSGDGGPAVDAGVWHPADVSVGPDGTVWIIESGYFRRVTPGGVISTVAGDGTYQQSADGLPALMASLASPRMIYASPDGGVYFDDGVNGNAERIRRLASVLPRFDGAATLLPSDDGALLYVFDASGRHLETRDGRTGETRLTFAYDDAGRLASITDGYGAATTVVRDTDGAPTAIEAPDGRTTVLSVADDGLLSQVTNPAGDTEQLSYDAGGLLTERVDPRTGVHTYTYDEVGRLLTDTGPGGRSLTLSRERSGGDAFTVSAETAEGRVERYAVDGAPGGGQDRSTTAASGLATTKTRSPSGGSQVVALDGTDRGHPRARSALRDAGAVRGRDDRDDAGRADLRAHDRAHGDGPRRRRPRRRPVRIRDVDVHRDDGRRDRHHRLRARDADDDRDLGGRPNGSERPGRRWQRRRAAARRPPRRAVHLRRPRSARGREPGRSDRHAGVGRRRGPRQRHRRRRPRPRHRPRRRGAGGQRDRARRRRAGLHARPGGQRHGADDADLGGARLHLRRRRRPGELRRARRRGRRRGRTDVRARPRRAAALVDGRRRRRRHDELRRRGAARDPAGLERERRRGDEGARRGDWAGDDADRPRRGDGDAQLRRPAPDGARLDRVGRGRPDPDPRRRLPGRERDRGRLRDRDLRPRRGWVAGQRRTADPDPERGDRAGHGARRRRAGRDLRLRRLRRAGRAGGRDGRHDAVGCDLDAERRRPADVTDRGRARRRHPQLRLRVGRRRAARAGPRRGRRGGVLRLRPERQPLGPGAPERRAGELRRAGPPDVTRRVGLQL